MIDNQLFFRLLAIFENAVYIVRQKKELNILDKNSIKTQIEVIHVR